MKTSLSALLIAVFLPMFCPLLADEQKSEIITVGSDKFLSWYGRAGRTYFVQIADANAPLAKWSWAPVIESGNDENISHEIDGTPPKGFFRLKFSDQPTTDPDGDDFDYDGLTNWDEVNEHGTDPMEWDTDGDGLSDPWEIGHNLDPNDNGSIDPDNGANGDPDADLVDNLTEYWYNGNPHLEDTDGDGLTDGDELYVYFTILSFADWDGDNLNDYAEVITHGTDPYDRDSDNDTLDDGDEVLIHLCNPLEMDTDGDWMWDDWELDNNLDPTNAADGLLDADNDTLPNQLEFVFMDKGYDPTVANNAAAFPWTGDPDVDELNTQVEFTVHLTNPRQHDSDGDCLSDGWEIAHSFNARLNNRNGGPANHHPDADPDDDDLTNEEEDRHRTNPNNPDSDGDGVSDSVEINQGSNPNDPNDSQPPPNGTVPVNVTFGDPSGSHSEKYKLLLTPLEGDTTSHTTRFRTNRDYGVPQTDTFHLPKGARYKVELLHAGTSPTYRDEPNPDYDYTLEIPQVAAATQTLRILKDPQGIFGEHDESDQFFAAGKSADLFVMNFKTETVSVMPPDWYRRKLGVREQSEVTVTPSSAGIINWSLINQLDATVNPTTGYSVMFQADTRKKDTTLRATFDTGDVYDILWNVVQPTGERATKTSDLSFPAGTQGAGMNLEYTTLPDDVSFYQVEVREIDKGTTNVVGFFTNFQAAALVHTPNPNWVTLSQSNTWGDTAGFTGWGFPNNWQYGTYQWEIDVMWRTVGEAGAGLLLGPRTQLHKLHDNTGRSTVYKSGESAPRTP